MKKGINWRLTSDYIGAGRFLVSQEKLLVGTEYGVQCLPRGRSASGAWKAELGSRCVGLLPGEENTTIAACEKGLFVLTAEGEEKWGSHSLREVIYAPVSFRDGVLLTSQTSIHYLREWGGSEWRSSEWRFDFSEVLGASVKEIRLLNLFDLDDHIVVGAVDYDSGIGRVVVLNGKNGRRTWMSDPAPVSELFPAGQAVFVWCQTGYGKFETHMTRLDGHEIWVRDFAGVGGVRADGSLAMVIGSNESPAWDDWEYRQISPNGKVETQIRGKGRSALRPLCKKDGTVYYLGAQLPMDPSASRTDYTSYFAMPQEVLFQHLMGIRTQLPEYDIYLHRLKPGESSLEVIYQISGSYSFAELQLLGHDVILCDGQDIIAVDA